ncbi:YaaR family protein [bacterium]|nr:YaaR family protein [bacterium]
MKVEEAHTRFREFEGQIETGKKVTAQKHGKILAKEEKPSVFAERLRESFRQIETKSELDALLKEVEKSGDQLLKSPTYEHLMEYKELVTIFIKNAIYGIWQVEEKKEGRFVGKEKVYIVLKKIDKELAKLTEEVLKAQIDPISLAARIDDIRGLLVDLYS